MNTPENSKCKPISKSLLTPCRRPGLSRKIKTPLNTIEIKADSPIVDDYNKYNPKRRKSLDNPSVDLNPIGLEPTNKKKKIEKEVKNPTKQTVPQALHSTSVSSKQNVNLEISPEKCKPPDFFSQDLKLVPSEVITKKDNIVASVKRTSKDMCNTISQSNQDANLEVSVLKDNNTIKEVHAKNSLSDEKNFVPLEVNNSEKININKMKVKGCSSPQSDSSCKSNKSNKNKLKRLSMKKVSSSQDSISDFHEFLNTSHDNPSLKDYKISDDIENSDVSTKIRKKPAPISSDEESFENDISKIEEIKDRIKLKEVQLDELKRAAIYTKLHNVKDLKELTLTWKVGCRRALTQLLKRLQEHGQIEMTTLLQKFNIPENVMCINDCDD